MSDVMAVVDDDATLNPQAFANDNTDRAEDPADVKALVGKIVARIVQDKAFFKDDFDRMREDMEIAYRGATKSYPTSHYVVNIIGKHIRSKTDALYAKNPKASAKARERMEFAYWDETAESLQMAHQIIAQAQQAMAQQAAAQQAMLQPPIIDELGNAVMPQMPQPVPMPPGMEEAQAVIDDFTQGMKRKKDIRKLGRTLEILFGYYMTPAFKEQLKQAVRRACTTAVMYVEVQLQREFGMRPDVQAKLSDYRAHLDHINGLLQRKADGDLGPESAEIAELEQAIASLEAMPQVIVQEGIVYDFPQATRVIPDRLTTQLVGFIGARHITIEYLYTPEEIFETFGVELKKGAYKVYSGDSGSRKVTESDFSDDGEGKSKKGDLVCVWKHYDKSTGTVYYVADGHDGFLREPGPPDVFVEGFWPLVACTFNAHEHEERLFPRSDVHLMTDAQMEHNRSRQGLREHRRAARPRYVAPRGALDEEDKKALANAEAHSTTDLNIDQSTDITKVIQQVPVSGVDPNIYETSQFNTDMQMVAGFSEASIGASSRGTATGDAISAGAQGNMNSSSVDDLDSFLITMSRMTGQVMMREMGEDEVKRIVGPGAYWPEQSMGDIIDELYLEVEAGSSGKPNRAIEVANLERMLPFLLQMPGINHISLARESLRRLDDRLDLTEMIAEKAKSILAQNAEAGAAPPAQADPMLQGAAGGQNMGGMPQAMDGSKPPMAPVAMPGMPAGV